ncbi:MAG: PD-(D/E)XK nuclease family protein [Planctomycetota bacterium]
MSAVDTFDVLGVAQDEYVFANLIAWLLDPSGEHGLGASLLEQLCRFVAALGVDWGPRRDEEGGLGIDTHVRVNEENCGIVLKGAGGAGLVIVLRLFEGGDVRGLERVRAAGVPVIGLGYGPSAFPNAAGLPVWRLQVLAQALRELPKGRFSHLLADLRARLHGGRRTESALSAAQTFIQSQATRLAPQEGFGSALVEGVDADMLLSEDLSRAYVIGGLLGEGGQGAVYTVEVRGDAHFPGFANPVTRAVIKLAHPEFGRNLRREEEVSALGDPSLVRLLDAGATAPGSPYLILERLHRLPRQRLGERAPLGAAADVFLNLLQGLHELHFRRDDPLVLLDIKPENVLLRMPGACELSDEEYERFVLEGSYEPVFVDVGCAQDVSHLLACEGRLEEMVGTPAFLPPEAIPRLQGDAVEMGSYSRKTDVYALTLTFYALITGERPYASHPRLLGLSGADFLLELFELKHAGASPVDEAAVAAAVGRELCVDVMSLLEAGLAADPAARPSAEVLRKACEQAFAAEPHRPRPERYLYDGPVALRWRQTRLG